MGRSWTLAPVLASLLLGGAALAGAAPSAGPAADEPVLTSEDTRVRGGEDLVLRGRGFEADVHVTLLAGPTRKKAKRIGAARTGRRGGFFARVAIEEGAEPGRYVAVACHDRCKAEATLSFRILRER